MAWLLSEVLEPGKLDLAGTPIGAGYLQFYAPGTTVLIGESSHLYDVAYQTRLEQEITGSGLTLYRAFVTLSFLAWPFVPLSPVVGNSPDRYET